MADHPVFVTETTYEVSCLPNDHPERHNFTLRVTRRAEGLWAVLDRMDRCLSATGEWDYEPMPSNRTDEWKALHRFTRATAIGHARRAAPHLTIGPTNEPFIVDDMMHDDPWAARAKRLAQ